MIRNSNLIKVIFAIMHFTLLISSISAQSTAFKYQGSLTDTGSPANGSFQMRFRLFDAVSGGAQVGTTLTDVPATATNGVFTVTLDFGSAALSGANRWLEISVRRNSGESYVTLSPREPITSSPYSVRTLSAAMADDSQKLGGVNANQFVQTNDARLSDARNPLPGSTNYIQNQNAAPQAAANFNISGSGSLTDLNVLGSITASGTTPPAVAPAGKTRFYYDTATNKLRVSENGGAYVNLVGATGVSGSGTVNRIPFFSAATTLSDSNVFQSGSSIGIGTPTPGSGFELRGTGLNAQQRITDSVSGNSLVLQGGPASGMKITGYNYGTGTAQPLYLSTDGANTVLNSGGGNVGIGTTSPLTKLSVFSNFYGIEHTDGTVKLSTFLNSQGGWFGTTSNHALNFFTNDANPQMTLTTSGMLGIGNTAPTHALDVNGFFRAASPAGGNVVSETSGGTNAWAKLWARTPAQSWSVGTSHNFNGNQLYFSNENAGGGIRMAIMPNGNVGINNTNPPAKLYIDGSVGQSLGNSGLAKAMIFVQANGTMTGCYNATTGTGIFAGCGGITVTHPFPQTYIVNLGFATAGRIMSLTSHTTETGSISPIVGRIASGPDANSVSVTFWATNTLSPVPSDFSLIVY